VSGYHESDRCADYFTHCRAHGVPICITDGIANARTNCVPNDISNTSSHRGPNSNAYKEAHGYPDRSPHRRPNWGPSCNSNKHADSCAHAATHSQSECDAICRTICHPDRESIGYANVQSIGRADHTALVVSNAPPLCRWNTRLRCN
jgi:hypothetical protein